MGLRGLRVGKIHIHHYGEEIPGTESLSFMSWIDPSSLLIYTVKKRCACGKVKRKMQK